MHSAANAEIEKFRVFCTATYCHGRMLQQPSLQKIIKLLSKCGNATF